MLPTYFFHSTPKRLLPAIMEHGLALGRKGWLYLTHSPATALNYANMFDEPCVVLRIPSADLSATHLGPDDDDLQDLLEQRRSRRCWQDFTWQESIKICDQCTYAQTIPPRLIEVVEFPPEG